MTQALMSTGPMTFERSALAQAHLHELSPSGAYTYARGSDLQELKRRGVVGQSLVISAAHTDGDIDQTVEAAAGALGVYAQPIDAGTTDGLLIGRPVAPVVREFAEPRRLRTAVTTGTRGAS